MTSEDSPLEETQSPRAWLHSAKALSTNRTGNIKPDQTELMQSLSCSMIGLLELVINIHEKDREKDGLYNLHTNLSTEIDRLERENWIKPDVAAHLRKAMDS